MYPVAVSIGEVQVTRGVERYTGGAACDWATDDSGRIHLADKPGFGDEHIAGLVDRYGNRKSDFGLVGGPPSPASAAVPLPAKVVMTPDVSTLRIRLLPPSTV